MAIVKMNRITIIGPSERKADVLKALQSAGVLHPIPLSSSQASSGSDRQLPESPGSTERRAEQPQASPRGTQPDSPKAPRVRAHDDAPEPRARQPGPLRSKGPVAKPLEPIQRQPGEQRPASTPADATPAELLEQKRTLTQAKRILAPFTRPPRRVLPLSPDMPRSIIELNAAQQRLQKDRLALEKERALALPWGATKPEALEALQRAGLRPALWTGPSKACAAHQRAGRGFWIKRPGEKTDLLLCTKAAPARGPSAAARPKARAARGGARTRA